MAGPFPTLRRALMGAVLLFGLGQPVISRAETAWKPTSDDALLFDVRLGQYRLGDGVRGYQTPAGPCVDLADTIMALDLPIRLDKKLRRATGWMFEERRTITIDREADQVQIMNRIDKLSAGSIVDAPEGWCVQTSALSNWLGVELDADQANAILIIRSKTKLPVEMAMERRARAAKVRPVASFDLKSLPQAPMPYKGARLPSIDVVASAGGLSQGKRGGQQLNLSYEIYAAGEVGPVAYDARLSSNRSGVPDSLRLRAYRTDPDGGLLGPLKATHVAAGDVSGISTSLVAQSGSGRGALVTNRLVERRENFDRTDFRGELPRGWDAELYRNGQLIGFASDRADGRYEFLDVPLQYGQNRFEVVLYGPQGQIRREERSVPVGLDSIPPRQTFYWVGVNQEGHDLIGLTRPGQLGRVGWRGSAGLERGLNAKTSVSAFTHTLNLEDGRRKSFGEVALRRAIGPALTEVSLASDFGSGTALRAQMLGEFGKTYLSLESINAFGGYESDRVLHDVTGIHTVSVDQTVKMGRTLLPLHADARYTTRANGNDSIQASFRSSFGIGQMSLTGQLDWRKQRNGFGPDSPSEFDLSMLANARIGRVRLRGESRFRLSEGARLENLGLVAEWSGKRADIDRRGSTWRAEIGYDGPLKRGRAGLGYVRRFDKLSLTASVEAGTDGSFAGGLNLAFSLGPDPRHDGRIRVTAERLATQGQVLATVFRDLNGDGTRQSDEPLEPGVQVSAGRAPVETLTDAAGGVIVDSLEPFQPVLIGVDASSLPDPLVQPGSAGVVVTPRPGIAARIELPLVSAGEVDGTLVKAGGGPIEGVDLELINVEGRVAARTRTEFDGFFLFEGVPYGRYTVQIAKLSAEAIRAEQRLAGEAQVGGKTPAVHLGAVAADPNVRRAQGP